MSRSVALALLFSSVVLTPQLAEAAPDCPDGWFCDGGAEPAPPPESAPPGAGGPAQPPGPPSAPPREPPPYPPPGMSDDEGMFDESMPSMDEPMEGQDDAPPPSERRHRSRFHEWGFNLHLDDAIFGHQTAEASNAGMGGVGFSFRYRVLPALAFDAGIDLLTGNDFQGYSRNEGAFSLNTVVFFNPRDVVQLYALGGLAFSTASVAIAPREGDVPFPQHNERYDYFGGQLGLGVEVRLSRSVALDCDLIGFVRGRTDSLSQTVPEFEDPYTQRTSNTSGGGLLRLGATFYW